MRIDDYRGRSELLPDTRTGELFLPRDIGIIEYLCNLGALRRDVVQLYALPLRVVGLDGSPVRAIAVEE